MLVPRAPGGPDGMGGPGTPGYLRRALPSLGHVASPDPPPSREQVRGRWPGEVGSGPQASGCSALQRVVYDNYASPCPEAIGGVPQSRGTDGLLKKALQERIGIYSVVERW